MPCNIGVKSYARVVIPAPQPQTFKAKAEAPKIDADLLAKLGEEDPDFLEWVSELETKPLLQEALKRALANISVGGLTFAINAQGMLEAKGSYYSEKDRKKLDEVSSRVSERWQFEILGIVTELLGYKPAVWKNGNELILEAEEEGKSHPCDYIRVTRKEGKGTLTFEHFKSRKDLQLATAKFLALADKLGVKITIQEETVQEGTAFPVEDRHDHRHRHGHDE